MGTLVVAEHDGTRIRDGSRCAITAACAIAASTDDAEVLVLGSGIEAAAADAARLAPTVVADSSALRHPIANVYAQVIAEVCKARSVDLIVAASTSFAKDILPRAAALMGASMASDVTGILHQDGQTLFQRPMYAGAVLATVLLEGQRRVITVRASAFNPAEPVAKSNCITHWPVDESKLPRQVEYIGLESRRTHRPDVTEARIVVSGGRAFRSSDEFEQYVGRLADVLGGATGCTRALVDAGIAPNEWQVGQTGKVVAPELYFALGISGAIQHVAGMKGSKVVVAINSDPDAPIFSIANYGLVGDARELVAQLIDELEKVRA